MFDSSARLQRGTARRGGRAGDEDALHRMGFRDCAREAVRFLTENARLDPNSAVVQGIRRLLMEGPTSAPTRAIVGSGVSSDHPVNVCRVPRSTSGSVEEAENRSVTALRRRHRGIIRRGRQHHVRRPHAPTSSCVTDRPLTTCPCVVDSVSVMDRAGRSTAAAADGGEHGRRRHPLTTLQSAPASSSNNSTSTSTTSGDVQLLRAVDLTTAADVVECASTLVKLSQTDARVCNVITELLQLMDDEKT